MLLVKSVSDIANVNLEILEHQEWNRIRPDWEAAFEATPGASVFVSADWVETWLETFGDLLNPEILLFKVDSNVVGAALLISKITWNYGIPFKTIILGTSGESAKDCPWVEFNGILCSPGFEKLISEELKHIFDSRNVDEVILPGWLESSFYRQLRADLIQLNEIRTDFDCPYVDLSELRKLNKTFLETISRNRRKKINRAARVYGECDEVSVNGSDTVEDALEKFEKLIEFHQAYWHARGGSGRFSSERFYNFHIGLIKRLFHQGGVQILEIVCAGEAIGYNYNLVLDGHVYAYQTGTSYQGLKYEMPGYVCDSASIQHCLDGGLECYDFMAGRDNYKLSLCREASNLMWARFERPSLRTSLRNLLTRSRSQVKRLVTK